MFVSGKKIQRTITPIQKQTSFDDTLQKTLLQLFNKPKEVSYFKPLITDKAEIILLYADPATEQRGKKNVKRDQN